MTTKAECLVCKKQIERGRRYCFTHAANKEPMEKIEEEVESQ